MIKEVTQGSRLWINNENVVFTLSGSGFNLNSNLTPCNCEGTAFRHQLVTRSTSKALIKSHQHTQTWLWNPLHVVHEELMQPWPAVTISSQRNYPSNHRTSIIKE